jgi:hypothetical protein
MKDEFKEAALRVGGWHKAYRTSNFESMGSGLLEALDALVEAMPEKVDPKERFLELASRLMGSKAGSWRGIFKHHDEGELVAIEVFGVSLEQVKELQAAWKDYQASMEQPTPDPRDELCEAAVDYLGPRKGSLSASARVVSRFHDAVEAYRKGK